MLNLTGIPALDMAIGLSFVFFLLATLALALQELVASLFGLRARTLEEGLRNMLGSPTGTGDLVKDFYRHPLIDTLYRGSKPELDSRGAAPKRLERTKGPSYVSPRAFAVFVLDNIAPGADTSTVFTDADAALERFPPEVRARLQPLIDAAEGSVERLRTNVEAWYDDTMARVSGWYKRNTQKILLVIGAVLVLLLNANALNMGNRLWKDAVVRTTVVQQAGAAITAASQNVQPTPTPSGADAAKAAANRLDQAARSVDGVATLGVPMGWRGAAVPRSAGSWITAVFGWLLTIVAISLGAPFWFDLLGRFSRLRSSGKPETPLPATSSGKPGERLVTRPEPPTLIVQHEVTTPPAAAAGGSAVP